MVLRPLVLRSGDVTVKWIPDVPLQVVAARLSGQFSASVPGGSAAMIDTVRVLLNGGSAPVVGKVQLSHDAVSLTARYEIKVERTGLLVAVTCLALALAAWAAFGDSPDVIRSLGWVPLMFIGFRLSSSFFLTERWAEWIEDCVREAVPPS